MSKVKITQSIAGNDYSYRPNQELSIGTKHSDTEIPKEIAQRWLDIGWCVPVAEKKAKQSATAVAPAKAEKRVSKPKPKSKATKKK